MKKSYRLAAAVALLAGPVSLYAQENVEEVIVTATSRPESIARVVGTVDVIDTAAIERSSAKSLTELLSQNGVAFLNEWTPGQTAINIRGGASDGQGRDFRSQVLILVNGRRAGTANLSKLSPASISRIEIVRGPSSVIYGSQNIGGVVNIITKTGKTAQGGSARIVTGSWDLVQGDIEFGDAGETVDWYVGASAGERGDFDGGGDTGKQINTSWERRGAVGALGVQIAPLHRLEVTARTDGVFDAGFRGSAANYISKDDRYNRSLDVTYTGATASERVDWLAHVYGVQDIDNLRWASPVIRSSAGTPTAGTSKDYNVRKVDIVGSRFQPRVKLWEGNELLGGWDYEHSTIRSTRIREGVGGAAIAQLAPYDNNQTEDVHALYFEDAQSLFNDRLTVRGGLRWTQGETSFDPTPNLAGQVTREEKYDTTTYAVGFAFRATDALTLRAGTASGFRAPNSTELAADFTALGGGRTFGNPDLEPESSTQIEAGANWRGAHWSADLAVFRNVIEDRIVTLPRPNVVNTSDYANNAGDVNIEGAELQLEFDVLPLLGATSSEWRWSVNGGGSYHWDMEDEGATSAMNTRRVQRVYQYQAALGSQIGQERTRFGWNFRLEGVLHGPVWYNTEELLPVPEVEPNSNYIHRKGAFWLVNVRGELELTQQVRAFAALNNLLDEAYHPLLIATGESPYLLDTRFSNGGLGSALPGREFQVGVQVKF
ncbi:TonB-dependent receptor [Steroidobacter flavus]|uniref:TonB-dependent receptor n=1 Tax=Steroidobacter flavus TaxID=1842136 RepID=A0ABV8T1U1_9GAMM